VTANQDEISGHETFQLEFDRVTKRWYVRTMQDRYWSLEAGGGIQASDHKRSSNALFDLAWQSNDGTVALRANNGKFLATKRSGHLYANADSLNGNDSDAAKYHGARTKRIPQKNRGVNESLEPPLWWLIAGPYTPTLIPGRKIRS